MYEPSINDPHLKAQVTLVERQRDMLETKADFKRAQKERSGIRRQKADIEAKMKVSIPTHTGSTIRPVFDHYRMWR